MVREGYFSPQSGTRHDSHYVLTSTEAMEFYHKLGFVVCGQPVAGICGTFQVSGQYAREDSAIW